MKTKVDGVKRAATFLPLELIVDFPDMGQRELNKEWAAELKESIRANGLDTPLFVWTGGEEHPEMKVGAKTHPSSFLVAGLHRRAALRALRKEDPTRFEKLFPNGVPVRKFDGSLKDMLTLQLRENVDRKDPTAEELLPKMIRLRDEFKMSGKDIAKRIGRSPSFVSEIFSIEDELGEEGVKEVVSGKVTAKHALRAAKNLKAARKAGKNADVKGEVEKAKAASAAQRARGGERELKRASFKKLYGIYKSLPSMEDSKMFRILEGLCDYVYGERDTYPKELKVDASKKSKTDEEDDDEGDDESEE